VFFIPLFQLIYNDDNKLAADLCKKNKQAIGEFLEIYSDELYYIASKFNNRGIDQDSWQYRTKTGYTIQVNDDVSDTFLWLTKQSLNKSCAYRGDNGATFSTYIKSVLNSSFTFKDWLKWKTGVTGYIPKCINVLKEPYVEIYKLLRQNKPDDRICNTLNLEYVEFYECYQKIETALIETNQIQLLKDPKFLSIDTPGEYEENDKKHFQLSSTEFESPDTQPDIERVKQIASTILEQLSEAQRRLLILYWREGQTVQEIYETLSIGIFEDYIIELQINESKDIYSTINKTVKAAFQISVDNFPEFVTEYSITESSIKKFLKTYFYYFEN
jgi:RNA polymerase sigma factor (sigma-70 family)